LRGCSHLRYALAMTPLQHCLTLPDIWRASHLYVALQPHPCVLQNGMTRGASNSDLPVLALSDGEGGDAAPAHREMSETARRAASSTGARTLMTFRGCTQRMGCTILLKVLTSTL
jgi:hypothetical protein